jgi:NTP pyrophosphatase (non-canonical NTP hydrolase)
MGEIEQLTQKIIAFRDARDWAQFHNAKDLAICLNVESSELLELFLWKDATEVNKEKVKDELADIIYASLLLAHEYNLDIDKIVLEKLEKNAEKYPIEKSRNSNKKYNEL